PVDETDDDLDGQAECEGDCDDADAANFPGNPEVCDGQDNDCSGAPDFDLDGEVDADADGFLSCADCDDGNFYCESTCVDGDLDGVCVNNDCADSDAANFPGNPEVCDGQDNDCSPATSAGDGETDDDGDGVINCADCADLDPDNFPGNVEICDGQDNDCDTATSEFTDGDGDGQSECGGDCNDAAPTTFDGAPELCDVLIDNDCDETVDECCVFATAANPTLRWTNDETMNSIDLFVEWPSGNTFGPLPSSNSTMFSSNSPLVNGELTSLLSGAHVISVNGRVEHYTGPPVTEWMCQELPEVGEFNGTNPRISAGGTPLFLNETQEQCMVPSRWSGAYCEIELVLVVP
ncbi:MAG: putative metal-binding motif-containing protein, partial [Patescibacteria group bacterium]